MIAGKPAMWASSPFLLGWLLLNIVASRPMTRHVQFGCRCWTFVAGVLVILHKNWPNHCINSRHILPSIALGCRARGERATTYVGIQNLSKILFLCRSIQSLSLSVEDPVSLSSYSKAIIG